MIRNGLLARNQLLIVSAFVIFLGGCLNEAKFDAGPPQTGFNDAAIFEAIADNKVYVAVGSGRYRLFEAINFETLNFGKVRLEKGFVSDGSSSPIADDNGSRLAGFLHDALYRGAAMMVFVDGFQGKWTKKNADDEYCHQLKKLKASARHIRINCAGPKLLPSFVSPWEHHKPQRERYWKVQQSLADKQTKS